MTSTPVLAGAGDTPATFRHRQHATLLRSDNLTGYALNLSGLAWSLIARHLPVNYSIRILQTSAQLNRHPRARSDTDANARFIAVIRRLSGWSELVVRLTAKPARSWVFTARQAISERIRRNGILANRGWRCVLQMGDISVLVGYPDAHAVARSQP